MPKVHASEDNAAKLQAMWAKGKEAWKDVPNATEWVEKHRGNTVDEVCDQPPGTFKKFINEQESQQQAEEDERTARIQAAAKLRWRKGE